MTSSLHWDRKIGGCDVVAPSLIVTGAGKLPLVVMGGFVNGGKCEKSPLGLLSFLFAYSNPLLVSTTIEKPDHNMGHCNLVD